MIKFAGRGDFAQIIDLWHRVFGDSEYIIGEYLKRFYDRVLVYHVEDRVAGMLSLLPLSEGKSTGYYVYAVATDEGFRSRGIATALIEYSKALCRKGEFLVLVPANISLFDFYKKLGFSEISCLRKQEILKTVSDAVIPVAPITSTELLILRKEYFKGINFIEWGIDVLDLLHDVYGAKFLKLGHGVGFAVCEIFEGLVNVKELCCRTQDIKLALSSICRFFNMGLYGYTIPAKNEVPNAMIYGKKLRKPYFNLALD